MFYNIACTRDALLSKKILPFKMNLIFLMIYAVHGHVNFAALDYHGCCYRIEYSCCFIYSNDLHLADLDDLGCILGTKSDKVGEKKKRKEERIKLEEEEEAKKGTYLHI